jgi:hypothetical protein
MNMTPPLGSFTDVTALPAVRAVYAASRDSTRRGAMDEANHRMLCTVLSAAGVELGHYDHRIVMWLANFEPETVAVIARWVEEAARREEGGGG